MAEYKQKLSGSFECNGFAAKFEGKHLNIKIAGDAIEIQYSAGVFTTTEIGAIVENISRINEAVNRASMELI